MEKAERKFCVKQKIKANMEEVLGNERDLGYIIVCVGQGQPAADPEETRCVRSTAGKMCGGSGE